MLNELKRPSLDITLEVDIPEIQPIKHDLGKVEEFATALDAFYREEVEKAGENIDVKLVKSERTKVRKVLKTIEDNRKAMLNAFKKPIEDFETTSKRIEKVLKGTDAMLKEIVDADKAKDIDPFEGLSINTNTYNLSIQCTEEQFKELKEFMDKKGIKY